METAMGLFDAFKSEPPKLSPRLALAVGLLFIMAADGEFEAEEIGHLQAVVGDDGDLIQNAVRYVKSIKYEHFLTEASTLLNSQQKLSLLINMADSLLSDGHADPAEEKIFTKAITSLGMSEDDFKPHLQTISLKNNRSIF
jgi:uncharacterized tellurite resistance protein B-like protein